MGRTEERLVDLRITIEQPVPGVWHSLQAKDGSALSAKASRHGEALNFDFQVRVGRSGKLAGDQVRPEGSLRRFVYIRIGELAGEATSPWSRRMKIDIHDIGQELLDRAAAHGGIIETIVVGTGQDGTPACATVRPTGRGIVER